MLPSFIFRAFILPIVAVTGLVFALTHGGYSYTRLAAFAFLFVIAVDLVTFARGRLQNALLIVAALFFGLTIVEGIGQAMIPHVLIVHDAGLWSSRPELGWGPTTPGRYAAEKFVDGKSIYKVAYTIDRDLLRAVTSAADAPSIDTFGDSFTFGEGLDDPDTLAQNLANDLPGFRVQNFGFSAYSPAQALRELQAGLYDGLLKTPRVFVLESGPWHSERTSCKPNFSVRAPRYVSVGDKVEYRGPCTSGAGRAIAEFYKELASYRMFIAPIVQRPSHWDIENYVNVVAAVARIAREKYHVPLVMLYIVPEPHYLDGTGFTDQQIRDRLTAAGILVVDNKVDAPSPEALIIPGDAHPSALANKLYAEKLVAAIRKAMPEALASVVKSSAEAPGATPRPTGK